MSTPKTLRFNLTLATIPVELVDEKGAVQTFTLRQMNGTQRDAYLKANAERCEFKDGKFIGMKTYDGLQTDLVGACFFDPQGRPATKAFLQSMPANVLTELYDESRRMNKIGEDEKEITTEAAAKNEPSGKPSTSLGSDLPTSSASPSNT